MKDLASFFVPGTVVLDFPARKQRDALKKISQALSEAGAGSEKGLEDALRRREVLCSTGLGEGIAAPHALVPELGGTFLVFLRTRDPVDWKSLDGLPVRLVFALVGPAEDPATHLQLLSRLTRLLRESSFRDTVLAASSSEEVASAFRRHEGE